MDNQPDDIMEDIKAVRKETTLEKHVQTILLSIITAAIMGGFWKITTISDNLIRMEEREKQRIDQTTNMQGSMNKLQTDMTDVKDRLIRLEIDKKKELWEK